MRASLFLIFATLDRLKSIQILYQLLKPIFFLNMGVIPRKAAKLEKVALNFREISFVANDHKTGNSWNQTFCGFSKPELMAP